MNRPLAAAALSVAGLTLAGRILGFGRSLVFSQAVGATCLGDAYNAANSLPNVLFEIVAGGVLAGVVIPVVGRHLAGGRQESVHRTVSALLTWTVLLLTVPSLLVLVGAGIYARAFAVTGCPDSSTALAALLVSFVPQIWLYGLAVVSAGVLQAHRRFIAAALAPLLSSLVVIAAYTGFGLLVAARGHDAGSALLFRPGLWVLGWGTTAGVLVLALTTLVPLRRLGLVLRPRLRFAAGDAPVIRNIALAGAAGLVLQQISVVVIIYLARGTGVPGDLTRFTWANAIYLLPYAVLAAPLLQVAFPRLSAAAEAGPAQVRDTLTEIVPVVTLAGCLGAALLAATAVPVARVFVLGPGRVATAELAGPIAAFAPAVVGFAVLGLASRCLLAQHRARAAGLATAAGWGSVIAAALLVGWLGSGITALAGSVSFGLVVGAVVGWVSVLRSVELPAGALIRPGLAGLGCAAIAIGAAWWPAGRLAHVGLPTALLGGLAVALGTTGVFLAALRLIAPAQLAALAAHLPSRVATTVAR